MKNCRLWKFIFGSLVLHSLLLVSLFLWLDPQEDFLGPTIELVQVDLQKPAQKKLVAKQKKVSPSPSLVPLAPEPQALEAADTDLETVLQGRPPSNEAERYLAELRDQIARHQSYPAASRSFREEGIVKLRLSVFRNGQVQKIELLEASKYPRLNQAAMKAVSKAAPFGVFPAEVPLETWSITLPVRFALSL